MKDYIKARQRKARKETTPFHDDWYCKKKNYTVWHFGLSRNPENEFERQFARQ